MIRSVLRDEGQSPNVLVDDRQKFKTATLLRVKLVLSGEASPQPLAEQLEPAFGRPVGDKVLFSSILPRLRYPRSYAGGQGLISYGCDQAKATCRNGKTRAQRQIRGPRPRLVH